VLLLVFGVAGYLWYTHPAEVRGIVRLIESRVAPCAQPVTYSIGEVDSQFGISKAKLVVDLKEAESIWEKPSDKNLFEYKESGGSVTVNLVYDERQAATDKLRAAGMQIDRSTASYDALKRQYDTLTARVEKEQSQYQSAIAAYKRDEASYNAQVQQANRSGGAKPAEYQRLQAQKAALEQQFANIKVLEGKFNADVDTLNALATTLNQLIVQLNINVDQYNRTGASAGEFEEGLYSMVRGIETIDIYEYSDHTQLVRVLAHEMGHALGLEHVADSKAIMYKINQGKSLAATKADEAELDRVCSSGLLSRI